MGEGKSYFLLGPLCGFEFKQDVAVARCSYMHIAFGEPIREYSVGWNEECDLCGTHRVVDHMLWVRMAKHKAVCGMLT